MRITGGRARGVPLKVEKGDRVRPATDRMREAVYSSLGPVVEGASVLDLFAGSGAYGLEALSRGAASVVFVEQNRKASTLLLQNLTAVGKSMGPPSPEAKVFTSDVFAWKSTQRFDLIFIDPPYEIISSKSLFIFQLADQLLARSADARICFEHPGGSELYAAGWTCRRLLGGKSGQPSMGIFTRDSYC